MTEGSGGSNREARRGGSSRARRTVIGHHLKGLTRRFELTPLRAAAIYLVLGLAALYASDVLLVRYVEEPRLSRLQAVKGIVEVLVTVGIIYTLTHGSRAPLEIEAERLRRQRQELQVLHRVLRHNLRNDLNVIHGYAARIRDNGLDGPELEWCRRVLRSVEDLLHYTEQANRIRRISEDGGEPRPFELVEVIPRILRETEGIDAAGVELELPESARVLGNHLLDEAIAELIANAFEHAGESEPRVTVHVHRESSMTPWTELVIEDNGPGIPTDVLEVVQEAREDPLEHLDGLGLWMVHWVLLESDGTMEIESDDGGTRIVLTLPSAMRLDDGRGATKTLLGRRRRPSTGAG